MFIALDRNDNRVSAKDAVSRGDYFCQSCGKPMIFKSGSVYRKHFAHKAHYTCTDSWNYGNNNEGYDMSDWHDDWQAYYPDDNVEVIVPFNDISHRADVLIGKTVIEFQHSPISSAHFQERTNYYLNLGYKVIWLFDLSSEKEEGKIQQINNVYQWNNPKSTFRDVTGIRDNVDLFFQTDEDCIIKVVDVAQTGFELFVGSNAMSKEEFLSYTGLKEGTCELPNVDKVKIINDDLLEFKKKYDVQLDKQQLRAVQSVEGANLVLSVPGSGKTTVLTYRLGYMTLVKGIKPENILAITFTKNAAKEMKSRLSQYFHGDIPGTIDIRTINSLSLAIVNYKTGSLYSTAVDDEKEKNGKGINDILVSIFKQYKISFYADTLKLYKSAISFVKSKLDQSAAMNEALQDSRLQYFREVFAEYNNKLKEQNLIDFNDQNNLALEYLKNDPELLKRYQDEYHYICVDEAQDTNQVQYELIKLLASRNNNIFMVGDEDQSIYGFNGSYPEALLNFRDEYVNPFILRLERNYRSTNQIVDKARSFIDKNTKRNKKDIYAYRGDGKEVVKIDVSSVGNQAKALCELIKHTNTEIAVLYRENSSAIPIIHELQKNNIPFTFLKNDIDFFNSSNYKKVEGLLKLIVNPKDYQALIDCKGTVYYRLYNSPIYDANRLLRSCEYETIFDALKAALQQKSFYNSYIIEERALTVKRQLQDLSSKDLKTIIYDLCGMAISTEVMRNKMISILLPVSEGLGNCSELLNALNSIKASVDDPLHINDSIRVKLSTVHSAKGKEFEAVCVVDVYDGVFPNITSFINPKLYEEERRVFYVAITRAKDELYLFNNTSKNCSFVSELFPNLDTYYDVVYRDKETGKDLLPAKHVETKIGAEVEESAPDIDGYICKNKKLIKQ